jgi:aerobic carbon-monoxide dehydrogenase large subunit
MQAFGQSQGGVRTEDVRFLTGHGRYVSDILPEGALHGFFLRSSVAHGRVLALDLAAARGMPGVAGVFGADELAAAGITESLWAVQTKDRRGVGGAMPHRPVLAGDRVRYVGEALALIVAETRAAAQDAAEAVGLEIDELPPSLALEPAGALHEGLEDTRAFDWHLGDPDGVAAAFARAAHVSRITVAQNRVTTASLEPRAAFADWVGERLHLCFNGQGVWTLKRELARMLKMSPEAIRVTTPDVGGGFGMKVMIYPEHFALAHAARFLGRPVAWLPDRAESMLADNGARDLVSTAELAFDAEHRLLAYRVDSRSNLGAYNSQFGQNIQSELFSKVLTGIYDIPVAHLRVQGFYTNTPPVDAYRGAGRPEANTLIERAMDTAARELGVSPTELRRINAIKPGSFPYDTPSGVTYDIGNFPHLLDRIDELAQGFAARRSASAARGLLRGLGTSSYIEAVLGEDTEGAALEFDEGGVRLFVGTQSNGQGHETVYARYLSGLTGIPEGQIEIVQGDSDRIARGGGTGGSRSVTIQSMASHAVAEAAVAAFAAFLETEIEAAPVTFEDGIFSAPGSNRRLTLLEAADLARARGHEALLRHDTRVKLPGRSYPNGAHICEVEIDPETGGLSIERYACVDDFGNLMNPTLVMGQVHGGVAQGFGQAVIEQMVYDAQGQLLTGSFMDYAMPRATDLPMVGFESHPTPSPNNPLGMKGCGEAGTVGALAALSNAVLDALWDRGVRHVDMPMTPQRIWGWLQDADAGRAA